MTRAWAGAIADFNDQPRGGVRYLDAYLRTVALLEEAGLPERYLGAGTIHYFLTVEGKTPDETVRVILGNRSYDAQIADQPRKES